MLVFEKNGQGKWDFDYEVLKEKTNELFADSVKGDVERSFIKFVDFEETENYVHVYIVTVGTCIQYTFDKETQRILHDVLTHTAIEKFHAMLTKEVK